MRKVIITGANGFLGNKLACVFVTRNITVYALDLTDNFMVKHELLKYYKCDLEKGVLPNDSEFKNADVLFHFAWNGVNSEYRNNYKCQVRNIFSLLNILSFAHSMNISKTIILGSASEYAASEMPITGYNFPGAVDAYGAIKSACHIISRTWSFQKKLPLIWVVPSSIYGPGRDDNNILTYTIKTLLKGDVPSFTALEQRWDYIYIDDFIYALLLVAEKGITGKNYALGFGETKELREFITIIRDRINPSLQLGIGERPYKGGKPDNSDIDISELRKDTGFIPRVSFNEGIGNVINWFRKNNQNI